MNVLHLILHSDTRAYNEARRQISFSSLSLGSVRGLAAPWAVFTLGSLKNASRATRTHRALVCWRVPPFLNHTHTYKLYTYTYVHKYYAYRKVVHILRVVRRNERVRSFPSLDHCQSRKAIYVFVYMYMYTYLYTWVYVYSFTNPSIQVACSHSIDRRKRDKKDEGRHRRKIKSMKEGKRHNCISICLQSTHVCQTISSASNIYIYVINTDLPAINCQR